MGEGASAGLAEHSSKNVLVRAADKWDAAVERLNVAFGNSILGRYFCVKERGSKLSTELRAGTVTFLTMAYILAVNANILKDSGGPCNSSDCTGTNSDGEPLQGQPFCQFVPDQIAIENGLGFNSGYLACVEEARRSMISATSAAALIACFLMGAAANLPLAIAPGMGINAFFTYTVVGFFGTGGMNVTYGEALAACFIEGWIFILIAVSGVRGKIIQLIPKSVMLATAGGIGLFLSFIGLQGSEGLGIVTFESATLVTIGGCPAEQRANMYTIQGNPTAADICAYNNVTNTVVWNQGLGPKSSNYACLGKKMSSGTTWLGIMGGAMMVLLMGRNWRGAIMSGILFVTFVSWIPNTGASYLKANAAVPGGEARWEYFKKVVVAPNISKTAVAWSWNSFGDANLWAALISFLYLDFLDTTGTLFSMATFLDKSMPGFIDKKHKTFPRQVFAFCVDGFAIVVGALMGIAPLTVYIESATGIKEGGRTGITAIMVSFFFFIALFFTPIISAIPPYATGPALILVGALMMENILDIDWLDVGQAVPAFLTVALIPLTYSIAYGVIAGIGSYLFFYIWFLIYDLCASYWTGKPIKEILYEAIPEAFQKEKPSDADNSEEGKDSTEAEAKETGSFSKVYRTHVHDEHERTSVPKADGDSFSAKAYRAHTDPPAPAPLASPSDVAKDGDKV